MSVLKPPPTIITAITPQLLSFLNRLRSVQAPVGTTYGFSSWWRSKAHNAAVGGNPRSQHLLGLAVDTTPNAGAQRVQLAAAFRRAGLVPVDEGDHIHVQAYGAGVIPQEWFDKLAV